MLPPVGGLDEPAASKAPTSVIAIGPALASVMVAVSCRQSFVTFVVCCVGVADDRASVVDVVVTTLALLMAAEPVPHCSHHVVPANREVMRARPLSCVLAVMLNSKEALK